MQDFTAPKNNLKQKLILLLLIPIFLILGFIVYYISNNSINPESSKAGTNNFDSNICWDKVLEIMQEVQCVRAPCDPIPSYSWPDGCRGSADTSQICTQALVGLTASEIDQYSNWVSVGKPETLCSKKTAVPDYQYCYNNVQQDQSYRLAWINSCEAKFKEDKRMLIKCSQTSLVPLNDDEITEYYKWLSNNSPTINGCLDISDIDVSIKQCLQSGATCGGFVPSDMARSCCAGNSCIYEPTCELDQNGNSVCIADMPGTCKVTASLLAAGASCDVNNDQCGSNLKCTDMANYCVPGNFCTKEYRTPNYLCVNTGDIEEVKKYSSRNDTLTKSNVTTTSEDSLTTTTSQMTSQSSTTLTTTSDMSDKSITSTSLMTLQTTSSSQAVTTTSQMTSQSSTHITSTSEMSNKSITSTSLMTLQTTSYYNATSIKSAAALPQSGIESKYKYIGIIILIFGFVSLGFISLNGLFVNRFDKFTK